MSLKNLLALVDDKLRDTFERKPFNHEAARNALKKRLQTAHDQFASATPTKGRKLFKIANGIVEFSSPVPIEGKATLYMPSERFPEFLGTLTQMISRGEFDKELEAGETTSTNKLGIERPKRKGWSPERRAAFEAAQAAKKK